MKSELPQYKELIRFIAQVENTVAMFNTAIKFILIILLHLPYYVYSAAAAGTAHTICSSDVNSEGPWLRNTFFNLGYWFYKMVTSSHTFYCSPFGEFVCPHSESFWISWIIILTFTAKLPRCPCVKVFGGGAKERKWWSKRRSFPPSSASLYRREHRV